jgi:hypothetical protein
MEWVTANRWVRSNILRYTGCFSHSIVEDVSKDTGRNRLFGILTGPARKVEFVRIGIFLGVEHIRAITVSETFKLHGNSRQVVIYSPFAAKTERNLLKILPAFVTFAWCRGGHLKSLTTSLRVSTKLMCTFYMAYRLSEVDKNILKRAAQICSVYAQPV